MLDAFLYDMRYAARTLRRNLFLAGVTAVTLGLGIGVVTALFAVIHAVLLQPIATDQDRVVRIWKQDVERGLDRDFVAYPEFLAWREDVRSFARLAAINYGDIWSQPISLDGQPTSVALTPVSRDFFQVLLGAAVPLHGRWFQPVDEAPGAELVGVVSERFWRRMGADPEFVGRRLTWAGSERTLLVIGIAPAGFDYPLGADIWVPIARFFCPDCPGRFDFESRRFAQFELLGRLAAGVSLDQARAELAVINRRVSAQFPGDYRPVRVVVEPVLHAVVGNARQVLLFLFAAAGLVFVIAGVNIAALLLIRGANHRRELAVRIALGASHARLARQALAEGLWLGGFGALCGLVFARLFLAVVHGMAAANVPRIEQAALDTSVVGFGVVAALGWVLALGTAPIWSNRKLAITPGFRSSELSFRGVGRTSALRVLTIAEIASAVTVAIGAGLLVRSFIHLQAIDRGFEPNNLAVIPLLLPESRYPDPSARLAFYQRLLPHLTSIPGLMSAAPIHMRPGSGVAGLSAPMRFEGQTPEDAETNPWATFDPVTPSYFRTLGIPIVRGRGFTGADTRDAAPVAIVSEAVARRYWPGQEPLGKRLEFTSELPWFTVVGVAADLRYRELTKNWLTVYFPAGQFFFFSPGGLVVRIASAPAAFVPAIRQSIQTVDPHVAIHSVETMNTLLSRELSRPRTALAVAALFALMAVFLAAIGVYAVMSHEVVTRRHELAVRSALGASPARIFRAAVRRSLALGAAGAVIGVAVASMATRLLRALLFGVEPADPSTFLAGAGALVAVVLLASALPAVRAAATDPVTVLRAE